MSDEVEIDLLRERLQEYRALLKVSYNIIFMPHKEIERRQDHKNMFLERLLEHGIIEEKEKVNDPL